MSFKGQPHGCDTVVGIAGIIIYILLLVVLVVCRHLYGILYKKAGLSWPRYHKAENKTNKSFIKSSNNK